MLAQLSVVQTIARIAAILEAMKGVRPEGAAMLNCEDECLLGASLGLPVSVMRHPWTGQRAGGDPDYAFPKSDRNFKKRMDEVIRTVAWQQLCPPCGCTQEEVHTSEEWLKDRWRFQKGETWMNAAIGQVVEQKAPAVLSRSLELPRVSMDHCSGVTLSGLTIDHLRKPYSRGLIESCERLSSSEKSGSLTVRFADAFPVSERTIMPRYCVYDFHTHRFQLDMEMAGREFLGDQRFRLHMMHMPAEDLTGQEFYIWHTFHFRPAILLEEASDLTLRDVTIHSQPGMGIVGHHCEDILLERLRVIPSQGEHMSTNTDATHFVSCKGKLIFRGCSFEGHGDDATNVHTFYHDIQLLGASTVQGRVSVKTHSLKLDYPDAGDEMQLVDKKTLLPLKNYRVLSVEKNETHYTAALDAPVPPDAPERCYLANLTRSPAVIFENCTAENHWARSVLLKCHSAVIQNCLFRSSVLQAIHIAAESWWHEGVACENIIVRGNHFVDCGLTGHASVGGVKAEMAVDTPSGTPQKHLLIENNLFDLPGVPLAVSISNAEDVTLRGNVYLHCSKPIEIHDCLSVKNEDE